MFSSKGKKVIQGYSSYGVPLREKNYL